jgi:hypothetical protein
MGDAEQLIVRVEPEIASVAAQDWDACANPSAPDFRAIEPYNPFISHAFLHALEASGCVTAETGWAPQHLVLGDGSGKVLACMPCYLKGHSMGEYVFDHGWADAYERAGGHYYPKLQSSVPFTPVAGRRLLVPPCGDAERRERFLISTAVELLNRQNVSSLHLTFLTTPEWDLLGEMGLLQRTDQQFHWVNDGYASFDDFLDSLTSRKRKAIRKERREAFGTDMEVEWVTGADLSERHWDAFYEFYMDTGARKWGSPYLNRRFFSLIGETMADQLLLVLCHRAGSFIAGALNFIGGDTLYGRYWGCREDHKFLHFELCYYQAIDYAIAHGLGRVEAGAQGPHKLSRGYLPQITLSAHYIADPSLRRAIEQFLSRERAYVEMESQALASHAPYRCGDKPKPGDA